MNAEQAIRWLEHKCGGRRGATTMNIDPRLRFELHQVTMQDATYGGLEFIAIGPRGGRHYIGINSSGEISYGPKGYEYHRGAAA